MLGLGLTGCMPYPNFEANPTTYKTVAFVSLLPQSIVMSHVGFTVFQNDFAVFPVKFDPNALAIQTALPLLASRYQVKDLGIDNAAFLAAVHQHFSIFDKGIGTDGLVQDELKATVKPGQADLIVVLDASEPPEDANFVDRTVFNFVGLASISPFGKTDADGIVMFGWIKVFDGTTFQLLAYGTGGWGTDTDAGISDLHWRGEPYDSLSTEQGQKLDAIEQRVIRDSVANALQDPHAHLLNGQLPVSP